MAQLETERVRLLGTDGRECVINKKDFDPAIHEHTRVPLKNKPSEQQEEEESVDGTEATPVLDAEGVECVDDEDNVVMSDDPRLVLDEDGKPTFDEDGELVLEEE